jgi:TatD family-associated radical SAM protein
MKLDELLAVAKYLRERYPEIVMRINTNGQANLYHNQDVTPKFSGLIDKLSVSLNAPDAKEYQRICHSDFGEDAFTGILEFSRLAKKYVPSVRLTVVDVIGEEKIEKCRKVADENGLSLYVRHSI